MPWAHHFRYFQIRNYVREHLPGFETASPDKLNACLKLCTGSDHAKYTFYNRLHGLGHLSVSKIKLEWEREVGLHITETNWNSSLEHVRDCSLNVKHRPCQGCRRKNTGHTARKPRSWEGGRARRRDTRTRTKINGNPKKNSKEIRGNVRQEGRETLYSVLGG